jgi:hypothetical protein
VITHGGVDCNVGASDGHGTERLLVRYREAMPISLPARPLGVKPPGKTFGSDFWLVLLTVFVGLGCALIVLFPLPALVSDYAVRDTAKPIAGATIEHGSCTTKLFLVSCDADLALAWPGKPPLRRTLHYFFVDAHSGDYSAQVVVDPNRPEDMTTDLALEKMTNRLLTMAIGGPIFLGIALFTVWFNFRSVVRHRALRRALSGQILRPATLKIVAAGRRIIRTSYVLPDGRVLTDSWKLPKKSQPIVLDAKQRTILGVTAGDGRFAMPLDRDLKWVRLTKEERAAALRT